ncbi:MAG: ASCH domain-containing protein [Lachnospiraceae bacterium]
MLMLSIDRDSFEQLLSGEKKEEYREIKPYYTTRLQKVFPFTRVFRLPIQDGVTRPVSFKIGVSPKAPSFTADCYLKIGGGQEKWGADPAQWYYVLTVCQITQRHVPEEKGENKPENTKEI